MNDRVSLAIADGIADVRLVRPDRMNALDPAMFAALADTIDTLATRRDIRVVVLSGTGRAFCAGLDMESMAAGDVGNRLEERTRGIANDVQYVCTGWRDLPMPVIAAAHGVAMGGGFQLLAGADIRIAHPDTRMAIREIVWGLVPDMGGFALWRGTARDDVLRDLVYTGREFSGAQAHAHGLVTYVDDDPLARALTLAREIAARSPDAVRACKRLFATAADGDAATILRAESAAQVALIGTPNQREAVAAGLARRPASFVD